MNTKVCTGCGETKPATTEFWHKQKRGKYGVMSLCKECRNKSRRKEGGIIDIEERFKRGMKVCPRRDCVFNGKEQPLDNFHKCQNNKHGRTTKCKSCCRKYNIKNRKRHADRMRERIRNDINYRIEKNLRKRLWDAIKGNNKSASTIKLLGCAVEYLKNHLESQFTEGMNWDNYGKWHIDHIIPCASFDFTDPFQQRECFHFSNLQPLWAEDNLKKGSNL